MPTRPRTRPLLAAAAALLLPGCAALDLGASPEPDAEVYRRAEEERNEVLEREVERLRADLRHAEEAMVAIESGQRGDHTRANAVSATAEARIAVERAGRSAPWRRDEIADAQRKLDVADRQLQAGHFGSAVFFALRAHRVADAITREASHASHADNVRYVRPSRLNLRAEPSRQASVLGQLPQGMPVFAERSEGEWALVRTPEGEVGWVFAALLSEERGS
jgi:hypothetical protein